MENLQSAMAAAMGERLIYLRRAWRIQEPGRLGFITQERMRGSTFYVIYLRVDNVWSRLVFKLMDVRADLYLAVSPGEVVEIAVEDCVLPSLQLMIEDEVRYRWWCIEWMRGSTRMVLCAIRTTRDPFSVVI